MSNAVSALNGATFEGFAAVRDLGLRGMITLRGDLSAQKVKTAVKSATGYSVPGARKIEQNGDKGAAWMSHDELLLFVPYKDVGDTLVQLASDLTGVHHLAVDVSDARVTFGITGSGVREVVAKLSPADVSPAGLAVGEIRRSRIAQVAAAFWLTDEDNLELVTFRSTADYAFNLLKNASQPKSEVGFF